MVSTVGLFFDQCRARKVRKGCRGRAHVSGEGDPGLDSLLGSE
jgi:hypothetical protein